MPKNIYGAVIGIQAVFASIVNNDRNDPGAGEKLATVPKMQPDDVEPAVAAVQKRLILSRLGKIAGQRTKCR